MLPFVLSTLSCSVNMERLALWPASEHLPGIISSFSASGRVRGPLGEVRNGLEGVGRAALEVCVMSQATGIGKGAPR